MKTFSLLLGDELLGDDLDELNKISRRVKQLCNLVS